MSLFFPSSCLFFPSSARLSGLSHDTRVCGLSEILPCVAVQAVLAEVLALSVLALIVEEAIKVLDPGEVMLTGFLDHQQIYAGHSIRLGAEPVNSHALIPAKYIDGQGSERWAWGHRSL